MSTPTSLPASNPLPALPGLIDHTLLKPDSTHDDLRKLCEEARTHDFHSVCVQAVHVAFCVEQLRHLEMRADVQTHVHVVSVVGFPQGASPTSSKVIEAREAVRMGASEIDMVIALWALKNRELRAAYDDIAAVVQAVQPHPVKVILETGLLSDDEIIMGCTLASLAGAAFVKTSTGFGPRGATVADVVLMRRVVGPNMGIKASGGIRTEADARALIAAGATRLGMSASVSVVSKSDVSPHEVVY